MPILLDLEHRYVVNISHTGWHGACVLSCVQLFVELHLWELHPWGVACQAPLSMEFRQENWSGLPFPIPGGFPNREIKPTSLVSPALAGGFFTNSNIWEAHTVHLFFDISLDRFWASLVAQMVENLPAIQETGV